MKYFIITGTSSGLGEALAEQVILQNHKVFCIARRMNDRLKELATEKRNGFWYFEQDLSNITEIPQLVNQIFSFIDPEVVEEINLINNAGVVAPVGPLGKLDAQGIEQHISINLTAPLALTNEFIRAAEHFTCRKNVVNITSGAAQHPYHGWSLYCSSKAGIDMLTQVTALEQQNSDYPVRVLAIAPGVVNTPMQGYIRQVNAEDFPMKPKFETLHEQGKLTEPSEAAINILSFIESEKPASGAITDLRNRD